MSAAAIGTVATAAEIKPTLNIARVRGLVCFLHCFVFGRFSSLFCIRGHHFISLRVPGLHKGEAEKLSRKARFAAKLE